jgi:hypothetical protein
MLKVLWKVVILNILHFFSYEFRCIGVLGNADEVCVNPGKAKAMQENCYCYLLFEVHLRVRQSPTIKSQKQVSKQ